MISASYVLAAALSQAQGGPELTVYNGGFALVKEQREFDLKAGVQTVVVEDVAAMIQANSVAIKSLSAPGSFTVWEQSYQYDLISVAAILNKAVGKTVILNRVLPDGKSERIVGTLMSAPSAIVSDANGNQRATYNGMVLKTNDGRILLNPSGEVEVPSIPGELMSKPTLVWQLDAKSAGRNVVGLSYLTNGIGWSSDYVISLDKSGLVGDVKGWVTMNNNSGATYANAKLKLLAGDVNRAPSPGGGRGGTVAAKAMMEDSMGSEAFADYHLYTLPRPTTIKDKEIKQLNLLESTGVKFTRRLVLDSTINYYRGYQPNPGDMILDNLKPTIFLDFVNSEANRMGMALPRGTVKVFQPDSSGSLQMIGESGIDHTPKDEKVSLVVGQAFDVRASRKRTSFNYIRVANATRGAVESFEIEIRNRKDVAEKVEFIERFFGEQKITESSVSPEQLSSNVYRFVVDLKPNEVKKFTFTVESRW